MIHAPIPLRGRLMQPGVYTPYVDGKPTRVRFTREAILRAFERLKARLAAGREAPVHLTHPDPDISDFPLRFGRIRSVGADLEKGELWLTDTEPLPEILSIFPPEAWEKLLGFDWSIDADIDLRPLKGDAEADFEAVNIVPTGASIVGTGAFAGTDITTLIPSGLAARLAAQQATRSGGSGREATKEKPTMPKLDKVEDIPEDVRSTLTPEEQQAYVAAYNAAIEAGSEPAAAHEAAMGAVKEKRTSAEDASDDEKEDLTALDAYTDENGVVHPIRDTKGYKKRKTSGSDATRLLEENTRLKAQLAALDGSEKTLSGRLDALTKEVQKLSAANASMAAEKAHLEATADVTDAIRNGRALPAEQNTLTEVRKTIGQDLFRKMIASRPRVLPLGEMGHQPDSGSRLAATEAAQAERMVEKLGPAGAVNAGLHRGANADAVTAYLIERYASDPTVARVLRPQILAAKAAGSKNGGGN